MCNYLIAIPGAGARHGWLETYQLGLRAAAQFDYLPASSAIEEAGVSASLYPREYGDRAEISHHGETASWLMSSGFWLCGDLASGQESALLARYLSRGLKALTDALEGPFMLLIKDGRDGHLHLLTDMTGSHHVYHRQLGGTMFISGSSLLLATLADVQLDLLACQEYLSVGNLFEDRSLYQEIKRLAPASHYRFAPQQAVQLERYWSAASLQAELFSGREAVEETSNQLRSVLQRTGQAAHRPVTDLTGGYDSRLLFAAWTSAGITPATFVSGARDSADVTVAAELSRAMGATHLYYDRSDELNSEQLRASCLCTDGEYDIVEYAGIRNSHLFSCRAGYDLNTNGSFGEVARGYWWELLLPGIGKKQPVDARKLARKRYVIGEQRSHLMLAEHQVDLVEHYAGIFKRVSADVADQRNTLQMDIAYLGMRMRSWQGRIASSTDRIRPNLSPFQFRSVMELLLQTHWRKRLGNRHMAKLVQHLNPTLAAMATEHGHPCEPMGLGNLIRFWPLAAHTGQRVLRKLGIGGAAEHSTAPVPRESSIQKLWRLEDVRACLAPADMVLSAQMNPQALEDFIQQSQQPGFNADGMWQRLLSIEYSQHLRREALVALAP